MGRGGDPGPVLPGPVRVLGQDPQHRGHRELTAGPGPGDLGQQFRPGPAGSGTPVAAGSWQASATTAARVSSLIRRGRPERGRSASPSRPRPANRPRHLRTVSTLTRRSAAIRALSRPRAAASTICAEPVPVRRLRPPDAFVQSGTLAGAQHDRHSAKQRHGSPRVRSQRRNPLPGTGS
jgi:hypothetical protein